MSEALAAGAAKIEAELPGWRAVWRGYDRRWRALSPTYADDGIVIEGRTPDEVIARVKQCTDGG